MLRDSSIERLPSYHLGLERGVVMGKNEGKLEGKLELALQMIHEFNLLAKDVAEKCQIPLHELLAKLNKSEPNA